MTQEICLETRDRRRVDSLDGLRRRDIEGRLKTQPSTTELVDQFKKVSSVFGKDDDSTVTTTGLGTVMISLGQNLSFRS